MDHRGAVSTLASERYILGEMSERERHLFEEHFFDCPECADDVRTAGLMRDTVRAGALGAVSAGSPAPRGKVLQLPAARTRWWQTAALPWAAAAALALVAGYQSLNLPQRAGPPFAVAPVTLRPDARGQATVVRKGAGDTIVFALDVSQPPAKGSLRYDLRRDSGSSVASGDVAAPMPGAPLLLLVPGKLLAPGADYVLTLGTAGAPTSTADTFRFTVEPAR